MPGNRVLLICEDGEVSRDLQERLSFEAGNSLYFESSGQKGLELFKQNSFDLVIAQFGMFDLAGGELIKGLKGIDPDCIIIALLSESDPEVLKEVGRLGVYDFIIKPLQSERLAHLFKKGLELHALKAKDKKLIQSLKEQNSALEKQNILLAKRIEESTKNLTRLYEDLRSTYLRTIKALAQAIDARDHYTHSHSENVARVAVTIANEMKLSAKEIETIREACELHDLGKIGIEDSILSKTTPLTDVEWEQIKRHPVTGAKILAPLTFLNEVIELVKQHHEHYNGLGYPEGRRGEDIFLGARIIHLADAYESMRSARSYRKVPRSKEDAIQEVKRNSAIQFDPKVVEAFLKVVDSL